MYVVKKEIKDITNSIEWNAEDIEEVKHDVVDMGRAVLARDLWSRKWNLVFRGIPGDKFERPHITEEEVRKFMKNCLEMTEAQINKITFAASHRLPSGPVGKKNIIVRLVNLHDRDKIMEAAYKLKKGSGYGVAQDLPPELARERDRLLKKKSNLPKEERKNAKLLYFKTHPFLVLKWDDKEDEAKITYVKRRVRPDAP